MPLFFIIYDVIFMLTDWNPTSWLNYPNAQALVYKNKMLLNSVLTKLAQKPPLVSVSDILKLKQTLARASQGQAFILQAGDCAESFKNSRPAIIREQLKLIDQMIAILQTTTEQPVIPIGRIAGQYAKPRSFTHETQGHITLPSYRGDLINASAFNTTAREPRPELLLKGYASAKHTLGLIQNLYKKRTFYISHEALHLDYEAALTHQCPKGLWYNLSTHLPWVGIRTNQVDGAHIEFLRGTHNPIGIKVGPSTTPDKLLQLIHTLNPQKSAGRIVLITRLGATEVQHTLPALIQATQQHQHPVTWFCDPMHGNTKITSSHIKTRHFNQVWHELEQTLNLHQAHQSHLGGLHLEITPEPVTECLGGKQGPSESDLTKNYKSLLDPRLNASQAIEVTDKLARAIKKAIN